MSRIRLAVPLVVFAVALAGCSGDDGASTPATTAPTTSAAGSTTTASTTTRVPSTSAAVTSTSAAVTSTSAAVTSTTTTGPAPTTTTSVCPGPPFARTSREDTTVPSAPALLTAVRIANHDCYDRLVFQFSGPGLPEWRVEPAEPPFSGPSGIPVTVRGTSWLHVRFRAADAHTDDGRSTVGIAPVPLADAVVLRQVQIIEDFEGVVIYVAGMDAPRPFRVQTFTDPPRLAIDVRTN